MDCPHLEESARVTTPFEVDEKSVNIPCNLRCAGNNRVRDRKISSRKHVLQEKSLFRHYYFEEGS